MKIVKTLKREKCGVWSVEGLIETSSGRSSRRKEALTPPRAMRPRNMEPPYVGCYGEGGEEYGDDGDVVLTARKVQGRG